MARFRYIGPHQPRADGTYEFRVRSKKFSITFRQNEVFEIPNTVDPFILKCIRGHIDYFTKQKDYAEVV